ncbi:hypothetical protein BAZOLSSOX_1451 [uncultured Gammaproteobacteria bacterium]|jgi:predicted membrane channel-forming protein YqfA (hemolysin III family)|nr:hypothetical protein [uncultured Gammaproteobacteria bacterium]VVH56204.1 hypothetical protein BAZOLSSOX_612 [uncultured Gammaproteobacteria bacterium]VVH58292.1 hypothetical protein BAZOLSSOX_1114 [uncultured Gammaproteobacteria bacterium]VVH58452.1 hypothetical protein BAZOLSSOX_2097 [uncultured Gammaproteobacteria bacterium]VVH60510.1 hypothetical protein BAZOLSSOX_2176 [uncultured Gammaproteobacteria bacterium]
MFAIFFYHPHPLFLPEVFGFLFIYMGFSQVILFFWMVNHLIKNKNIKYKFLWFLSFCIMFIGVIFYFWFVYRENQKIKV